MNLLFDQNVSYRIIELIRELFPGARQVRELQLENATDLEICTYAKSNHYWIVTFDADFIDISNLKGHPPKVIWLRLGNTSTKFIAEKMLEDHQIIRVFISNDEDAFLQINKWSDIKFRTEQKGYSIKTPPPRVGWPSKIYLSIALPLYDTPTPRLSSYACISNKTYPPALSFRGLRGTLPLKV